MKKTIAFVILFLSVFSVKAQENVSSSVSLQKFIKYTRESCDVDSAIYHAQLLAKNPRYKPLLIHIIHSSFARSFIKNKAEEKSESFMAKRWENNLIYNRETLRQMVADPSLSLREIVNPIYYWNTIRENKNDQVLMERLTKEFMKEGFLAENFYTNRTGRYGLMIYQIINEQEELKPLATKLYNLIRENVKNNLVNVTGFASKEELDKRSCFRYLHAYMSHLESTKTNDIKEKEILLKTAFDYSPDINDRKNLSTDAFFVSGKHSFDSDYLEFIEANYTDKKQVLAILLKMALAESHYKTKLRNFYESNDFSEKSFVKYWEYAVDETAKVAPPITLSFLDNTQFSSKDNLGKWTLIDFWGTWCGPCRQEHPALQRFYESIKYRNINLITVACRDKKEKVLAYMNEKKWSFPVVMADDKIENDFAIQSYPSKVLLSPTGKYIAIPFSDWERIVINYCE
jgi:thiol-disulfide isomerase/thioredoxin